MVLPPTWVGTCLRAPGADGSLRRCFLSGSAVLRLTILLILLFVCVLKCEHTSDIGYREWGGSWVGGGWGIREGEFCFFLNVKHSAIHSIVRTVLYKYIRLRFIEIRIFFPIVYFCRLISFSELVAKGRLHMWVV